MFYSDLFPVFVSFFANWLGVFYLLKLKITNSITLTLQLLQFNIASITLSSEQSWIILLFFSDESLFCDHEKNAKVKKPSNPCDTSNPILSLLCQFEIFYVFKQWHSGLFVIMRLFFLLFHSSDSDSDLPEVRWHDDVQVGCKCTSLIKSYYIVVRGFTSVS